MLKAKANVSACISREDLKDNAAIRSTEMTKASSYQKSTAAEQFDAMAVYALACEFSKSTDSHFWVQHIKKLSIACVSVLID